MGLRFRISIFEFRFFSLVLGAITLLKWFCCTFKSQLPKSIQEEFHDFTQSSKYR